MGTTFFYLSPSDNPVIVFPIGFPRRSNTGHRRQKIITEPYSQTRVRVPPNRHLFSSEHLRHLDRLPDSLQIVLKTIRTRDPQGKTNPGNGILDQSLDSTKLTTFFVRASSSSRLSSSSRSSSRQSPNSLLKTIRNRDPQGKTNPGDGILDPSSDSAKPTTFFIRASSSSRSSSSYRSSRRQSPNSPRDRKKPVNLDRLRSGLQSLRGS